MIKNIDTNSITTDLIKSFKLKIATLKDKVKIGFKIGDISIPASIMTVLLSRIPDATIIEEKTSIK